LLQFSEPILAAVFNVSLSKQTPNQASKLVLANVEALAQNEVKKDTLKVGTTITPMTEEDGGANSFCDWGKQGLRKDERIMETVAMVEHNSSESSPGSKVEVNLSVGDVGVKGSTGTNTSSDNTKYTSMDLKVDCLPDGDQNCTSREFGER